MSKFSQHGRQAQGLLPRHSRVNHYDLTIVGQGVAATAFFKGIAQSRLRGSILAVTGERNWLSKFPRGFEMGQNGRELNFFGNPGRYIAPDGYKTTGEFAKDLADAQMESIFSMDNEMDCIDGSLTGFAHQKGEPISGLATDQSGQVHPFTTDYLVLCTGGGYENTFSDSGVAVLNPARGMRQLANELTTGLKSIELGAPYFRGKRTVFFGGGGVGAWAAMSAVVGGGTPLWIALDFSKADPTGRNREFIKDLRDKHLMVEARIRSIAYQGDPSAPPSGPGLKLLLEPIGPAIAHPLFDGKGEAEVVADNAVCNTGPNITSFFNRVAPPGLVDDIKPVMAPNGGLFGVSSDHRVIISSTAIVRLPRVIEAVGKLVPQLDKEIQNKYKANMVDLGAEKAFDSGIAMAEFLAKKST